MVAAKPLVKQIKKKNLKNDKKKNTVNITIPKQIVEKTFIKDVSLQSTNLVKYKLPSKTINENLVTQCLNALEKLNTLQDKKNAIFGDESQIFMEIRSIKLLNTTGNLKFILPHSTVASTKEICLITPDLKKGRKVDHEPTVDHWEQLIREAGVTSVKTVLPMRQLRVEYDQFELKRRLLTQHDLIMVDTRILNHVSHLLGKMFFKKHNMLIPVKINEKKDLKKNIDVGERTVMLRLNEGHTASILVGHTAMSQSDIKDNVMTLVKNLKQRFPGGEANIRSLSLKLPLSLSLPLYLTLRPTNSVQTVRIKTKKPKSFVVCEGELTTKTASIVRVAPDGTVHVKKQEKEDSESEDENDEEDNNSTINEDQKD